MNVETFSFRQCYVFTILCILLAALHTEPLQAAAQRPPGQRFPAQRVSTQERRMAAAQELREYRHRIGTEAAAGTRTMSARSGAAIRLDKSLKTSSTIFFSDDMESGVNGWTSQAYTGSDLWHQSTLNANSPTHSWWAGVELSATYNSGARVNDALISPPIDLTAAAGPVTL